MRLLLRPSPPTPVSVVFIPSATPGLVFRAIDNAFLVKRDSFKSLQATTPSSSRGLQTELFLSGPPRVGSGLLPWRVLFAQPHDITGAASADSAQRILQRVGKELSLKLGVFLFTLDVFPNGAWRFTQWKSGTEADTGGTAADFAGSPVPPTWLFLRRSSRLTLLPSLRAWARENHLPLGDAPFGRPWKRGANIVDYDAVAGLERKGLLEETRPVWYRVTVNVPVGEPDGGIMKAS